MPRSDGTGCHDLSFLNVVLSQLFHSPLSLLSRGFLVPLHFLIRNFGDWDIPGLRRLSGNGEWGPQVSLAVDAPCSGPELLSLPQHVA